MTKTDGLMVSEISFNGHRSILQYVFTDLTRCNMCSKNKVVDFVPKTVEGICCYYANFILIFYKTFHHELNLAILKARPTYSKINQSISLPFDIDKEVYHIVFALSIGRKQHCTFYIFHLTIYSCVLPCVKLVFTGLDLFSSHIKNHLYNKNS